MTARCKLAPLNLQKGEAPEALAAAKKELEIKRAASASKGAKVFYKVTVKVSAFPRSSLREYQEQPCVHRGRILFSSLW